MGNANEDNLLEILVMTRTVKALDNAVRKSKDYKDTLIKQDKVLDRLDNAGLDEEQKSIVDKAISATNDCGAVYGAIAYRLGLHDGIRLTSEIREIK